MKILSAISCLLILGIVSCNTADKKSVEWAEYDLSAPEKYSMPGSLLEISGITFNQNKADTFYAIQDEDGKLFRFSWKDENRNSHTKFAKTGDYEDLAIIRGVVYILKSNGTLYSFRLSETQYDQTDEVTEWKNLVPKGEYESMYGDEKDGKLYIVCKNCKGNKKTETVSGYIFQTNTDGAVMPGIVDSLKAATIKDSVMQEPGNSSPPVQTGMFEIDVDAIKPFSSRVKNGFRPSGIALNPLTSEWYIISGVNKLLVVTDKNWKVKGAYHLNGNIFNQPEGICFDDKGNLYISNEGDDISDGNILRFQRKTTR